MSIISELFEEEVAQLKEQLAATQAELDRHIGSLTSEWSSHATTRAELRASRASHQLCIQERAELESVIKLAVAELEQHARPLCSEEGEIEYAIDAALAILKGEP